MKIKITFKDPDGVYESIRDYVKTVTAEIVDLGELEQEMHSNAEEKLNRWIKWGEYLTVEFDTDAGTATVVPNS